MSAASMTPAGNLAMVATAVAAAEAPWASARRGRATATPITNARAHSCVGQTTVRGEALRMTVAGQ